MSHHISCKHGGYEPDIWCDKCWQEWKEEIIAMVLKEVDKIDPTTAYLTELHLKEKREGSSGD